MKRLSKTKENRLYIYNTFSLVKEIFKPLSEGTVLMYVCGITAYDYSHIGHARAYITFDIVYRYLTYIGYNVRYVRNFTDIDDKIIKKSLEEKIPISTVTEKYINEYRRDMNALFVLPPTFEPKATDTIKEMIEIIIGLIDKGKAYEKNGDVFFRVKSFNDYGKLSHKNIDELIAGARIPLNEDKENVLDFALWKKSKDGEPFWESPWGNGRPGWHIECSAMSMKFLGESIDIHGGGSDLVFPHHENEMAQSESYTGHKFVNYWMHNGFVNINNEKMSKSLKNFITVRDLATAYHPEVVRLFFMFTHYRSFIDFSYDGLESSRQSLIRLYQALNLFAELKKGMEEKTVSVSGSPNNALTDFDFERKFRDGMNDDFNTPQALSVIFNLTRKINKIMNDSISGGVINATDLEFIENAVSFISLASKEVLGILNENPADFINENLKDVSKTSITAEEIKSLIEKRNGYRRAKDYKKADEIRNMLLEKGVVLEDSGQGTGYKIIS